jgi:two-component system sensor histidine kinase PilS (NtrC family)
MLLFFFYSETGPAFLGRYSPELFGSTSIIYFCLTLFSAFFWLSDSPATEQHTYIIVFVDIIALTLLMHASGGVESGLGMLIAVSITGGALVMSGRSALLFAALATLFVISEQVYRTFYGHSSAHFSQAGFLGGVFFATALLTLVLSGRVRASEQLAQSRSEELVNLSQLNEHIIEHMRTGVLAVNQNNEIMLMNNPALRLLAMPMVRPGNSLLDASRELTDMLKEWRKHKQYRCSTFRPDPHGVEVKPHIVPLGTGDAADILIFLEDNSQIQREAQQMKLASLGRLTASIAHEIRNPLGAISHASQLFDESPELNPSDRRLTEIIKTNSGRVNKIIENVLQLSRRKETQPQPILIAEWVGDLVEDLVRSHGFNNSSLQLQIEPKDSRAVADPEQLRQVIINLCNNARDHTDEGANLLIRITGGKVEEFDHPVLDVCDNGPGIKEDVAKQMFEPFFSTSPQGTGLGLYITKELCEANQIRLEYLPSPTQGSCFRLHFRKFFKRRARP